MRCQKCQYEVPADMRSASVPVACPECGALLPVVSRSAERDPQEILARWSDNHWLDGYGPLFNKKSVSAGPQEPPPVTPPAPQQQYTPVATNIPPANQAAPSPVEIPPSPEMSEDDFFDVEFDPGEVGEFLDDSSLETHKQRGMQLRVDGPHGLAGHHLPAQPAPASKAGSWLLTAGQLLAYFGVGALTVGTVMVLVGYYGDNAEWLPTGWLTATAGQMLLFLGVITLVSGGMEQATQEITQKVDRLGDRIIRMEQRHAGPPRPNFAKQKSGRENAATTIQKLQRRVIELEQHIRQNRNS